LWPEARNLSGDEGYGPILTGRPDLVEVVDVPGANPDVDRLEDLLNLEESEG
jgi:CTP:molybdopterin cytidylyltransferase MocA